MSDSNEHDAPDGTREGNREERIEAVKRWVEYIESEHPETWGPQQNAIVNWPLDAARDGVDSCSYAANDGRNGRKSHEK